MFNFFPVVLNFSYAPNITYNAIYQIWHLKSYVIYEWI